MRKNQINKYPEKRQNIQKEKMAKNAVIKKILKREGKVLKYVKNVKNGGKINEKISDENDKKCKK